MRRIEFTPAEIKELARESIYHEHHIVRRRMQVLFHKSQGMPHQQIAEWLGLSPTTVRTYLDLYVTGGLKALRELHYSGKPNLLRARKDEIIAHLETDPPGTLKEAQRKIKDLTGLERSLPQVHEFLQENQIVRRQVKQIPAKADVGEQERFKTEELEPLIEQAQAHQIHLFFVDAAHFVWRPFLGFLYTLVVRYVQSASGRKRFNVLGALHAVTHELVTITNHTYINSQSVCELLAKLHEQFSDLPIVLILDNASYQRCHLVRDQAHSLGMRLVFLPPYSPNLNLIERLWKFVKKQVLYNQCYPDYPAFHSAILACLEQTATTHKEPLDTLLTPRFQTFQNVSFQP
ncbi:MAG: IS630 family transposase [Chloroflexi bacterium]|nr:IS630 family transposase [Chloroflexota bacterium]